MKLILTVCSNNYLAQARVLIASVQQHAPEYKVIVGLVDRKLPTIDYSQLRPAIVVPAESIGIPDFDQCRSRYDLVELNTCVKPSFLKSLIRRHPVDYLFYIDPDVRLYGDLSPLERLLETSDILLTPHVLNPIALDGLIPEEKVFLNYGTFNLGFLGLRPRSQNVTRLLDWWETRCLQSCYIRLEDGLFVDQLWMNLAPVFFERVHAVRAYGCNMAPWNVHERRIVSNDGQCHVLNDGSPLTFYHFSGYRHTTPDRLSSDPYNRVRLADRPDLKTLYESYQRDLLANDIATYSPLACQLLAPVNPAASNAGSS